MSADVLVASLEFTRGRLLATLDAIEKSGQDVAQVLGWRPGPGRAHIAWQAMHCAATHDKYLNVMIKGGSARDAQAVSNFGSGSIPSDTEIPALAQVREALATSYSAFRDHIASLSAADLSKKVGPPGKERTIGEAAILMCWHEAHHQGQMHLTWNLYKQEHGVK